MFASKIKLRNFKSFRGSVMLPGSKSIANRVLLCAALSKGKSQILNLPPAEDVEVLIRALKKLGIRMKETPYPGGRGLEIEGNGGSFSPKSKTLYLGNAGTAIRPLTAILCAASLPPGTKFFLKGDQQMNRRPIGDLVEALLALGADLHCSPHGTPPVEIHSSGLKGVEVELRAENSSQFISSLLLAAPLSKRPLTIHLKGKVTSRPYITLTLNILKKFGISIEERGARSFFAPAPQTYIPPKEPFSIEGDATAATYFLAAGALPNCGPVRVHGLGMGSLQGDLKFTELLKQMGARIELEQNSIEVRGPKKTSLKALDLDMNDMPDAAMSLAVLSLFCEGSAHIRGIANLRLKESERIAGLKRELEKLGAKVEEGPESLHIEGPAKISPALIESYQDHRMAMAFAIAAYGAHITIKNPACVAKTYRGFFSDFSRLCIA